MKHELKLLVIDDSPDDRELLCRLIKRLGTTVHVFEECESGDEGLGKLRTGGFNCVLLDYSMPQKDGLAILREIRLRHPDIAMVMMTGEGNERIAVEALKNGAQDYLLKTDLSQEALEVAIQAAMERKRVEVDIIQQANYDELTGLANRRRFLDRLEHALERSGATSSLAVIFMDLDGFKQVNDLYGHEAGDDLLREVAVRAKRVLRSGDTLARLGGDEFVVLLENLPEDGVRSGEAVEKRLAAALIGEPYNIESRSIRIGASTRLAIYPLMAEERSELLRLADKAMYENKQQSEKTSSRHSFLN
jgi:diguanylate cyclase (GGDEF)-like protein